MNEALELINKAKDEKVLSLCVASFTSPKAGERTRGAMMGDGSFSMIDQLWLGVNAIKIIVESAKPTSQAEAEKFIDVMANYAKKYFKDKS